MTSKEIRDSVIAFKMASKLFIRDGIPLKVSKIAKALKMANRIINKKCIELWIEEYKPYLYCNEWLTLKPKQVEKKRELLLHPHEFLVLCAQSKNYLSVLKEVLNEVRRVKFTNKNAKTTLKKTEVYGFGNFVKNEIEDKLNSELPATIKCSDVGRLKILRRRNYTDFGILEDWHKEVFSPSRALGAPLKDEELAYEANEKNKALAMRHVIGQEGANKKKEIDNKREIMKSLYSLRGIKPPFITHLEYFENDYEAHIKSSSISSINAPSTSRPKHIQNKKATIKNFIKKNKELVEYHPINKRRITLLQKLEVRRPAISVCNSARKLSPCSTAFSKDALMNKMNLVFGEEVRRVECENGYQLKYS